jgi:aspartyl-tRNA(Asn)/glutamyl-tRNA(Gln) amidotransferase subunit B
MNSFSGVERALDAEFGRQCGLIAAGGRVEHQTMLWDGAAGVVRPARSKEASHDYRYFPEPDLPPLVLSREFIDRLKSTMPELPAARRARFETEYAGLTAYDLDVLTASPAIAEYFEHVARPLEDAKTAANWVMGEVLAAVNAADGDIDHFTIRPADLAGLLGLIKRGTVSHTAAKQIFTRMAATGEPPMTIAERDGLLKVNDDGQLTAWVDEVFAEHPDETQRFAGGEKKLQGVLVGLVMKKSGGRADPKRVNQLLADRVGR